MSASGGWSEGDATFIARTPPNGALVTYYQRARHLYGPIEIEVLDEQGKSSTSSRRARGAGSTG